MESCCKTAVREEENREQETAEVATEASILTSVDHMQQPDAELLMQRLQNDEADFSSSENVECARSSSLDSVSAFEEELLSYNLPASDAALNVTFNVEVNSLSSCMSTDGLLDPKIALKIVYDLDESVGIDKCEENKTYVLDTLKGDCGMMLKGDCGMIPEVKDLTSRAGETFFPVVCKPSSLYTEDSSSDEAECVSTEISGKIDVELKGKISGQKSDPLPDSILANDELDSSSPNVLELEDKEDASDRTTYATSTPISSGAKTGASNQLDIQRTVTLMRHASSSTERNYVPIARRMLQMHGGSNTTEEHLIRNFGGANLCEPDDNIISRNESFVMSASEQDDLDEVFKDADGKPDETYTVSSLASGEYGMKPLHYKRSMSAGHNDRKVHEHGSMSSVDDFDDKYIKRQWSAGEQNGVLVDEDGLSLSHIDVYKGDVDVASYFVTEWPSVLTNDCHDWLRFTSRRKHIQLPQGTSSPQNIRIVVKSASTSSDLLTDWSLSSLLGQVHPSFNSSSTSVNELDDVMSSCRQLSLRLLSNVTRPSEQYEETARQLNIVGR